MLGGGGGGGLSVYPSSGRLGLTGISAEIEEVASGAVCVLLGPLSPL